jgi:thiamine-monophosphate kinase
VARKALRVNLSDLAAKGAVPEGFVMTLALREAHEGWLASFAAALGEDAARFGAPLLGGDTVSTPGPLMISITAFGRVPVGGMVRRAGARPGDVVAVTGTIGDAVLGLDVLRRGAAHAALAAHPDLSAHVTDRYRVPQPRTALAEHLAACATAAMDVSDGLAGDLAKLCQVSGVSAEIDLPDVPLSDAAKAVLTSGATTIEALIGGGDDYEILCAVDPSRWAVLTAAADRAGIRLTRIGTFVAGTAEPVFRDADGRPAALARRSYSHF